MDAGRELERRRRAEALGYRMEQANEAGDRGAFEAAVDGLSALGFTLGRPGDGTFHLVDLASPEELINRGRLFEQDVADPESGRAWTIDGTLWRTTADDPRAMNPVVIRAWLIDRLGEWPTNVVRVWARGAAANLREMDATHARLLAETQAAVARQERAGAIAPYPAAAPDPGRRRRKIRNILLVVLALSWLLALGLFIFATLTA